MINVLYVYGDILRHGGMENYMMNYFRNIDKEKVHIDFVVQSSSDDAGVYADEIRNSGSKVYVLPKYHKNFLGYQFKLMKILRNGKYQIVHAHCDAMNHRILRMAKACGIPVRISHSHNTQHILPSKIKFWYYEVARVTQNKYATDRWACSAQAGRWMFGDNKFVIVPNALEIDRYCYREKVRNRLRELYRINSDEIVIGSIGRFDYQKNHKFMIDLLETMSCSGKSYKLLLVGSGHLRKTIETYAKEKKLQDKVIFVGEVSNPEDYYNVMDIYIQPSLFEGFGMAILEAQINGLNCCVSVYTPEGVNISGNVTFLKLEKELWKDYIRSNECKHDQSACNRIAESEFDLKKAGQRMTQLYCDLIDQLK